MVAYNFKPEFASNIKSGEKRTTIRAPRQRSRHVRIGEAIQLYTGQRTTHCRKLLDPDPTCISILPIVLEIDFMHEHSRVILDGHTLRGLEREEVARLDGFENSVELFGFFQTHYHLIDRFDGFWIRWTAPK